MIIVSATSQVAVSRRRELVGRPMKRAEDPKFLRGAGRYLDDVTMEGTAWASFVRSPHPHARIVSIDASGARAHPGVLLAMTQEDLSGKVEDMPTEKDDQKVKYTRRPVLAQGEANYEGEAVAVVVASDRQAAEDASELVEVVYDPLPAVTDPVRALERGSPRVHGDLGDNLAYEYSIETPGFDEIFGKADRVVSASFLNQRIAPVPLEPRGVLSHYDPGTGALTVHLGCQDPFSARDTLARMLRLPKPSVRVVSPDVGGAFGSKISTYPEEVVVSFAAILLRRPVKWTESRRENILTTTQGRGQVQRVEAAVRKDGRLLALKVSIVADSGAYSTSEAVFGPRVTPQICSGNYDFGAIKAELKCAFTNKVPHDAYRGAGRPEASYLIERTMNVIAGKLKLDPVKVRQVNFIPADRFPFQIVTKRFTYDSGDYEKNLSKAVEVADYEGLRGLQRRGREQGRLFGVGVATYVEVCGFGPTFPQTASVAVTEEGKVVVNSGGNPHGQGHATPFAQIAADELGIEASDVYVRYGDTASLPYGTVTAGSRSAAVGGSAVLVCARRIRDKMAAIAARMMDTDADVEFRDGRVHSRGSKSVAFAEVASAAYDPGRLPRGMEPTLFEYSAFVPKSNTFPFGSHICLVEVDRETGRVDVLKYVAVDDCGRILNPLLAEGQVMGGMAQGLGQALMEELSYDEGGQLLTATLADYGIPTATSVPGMSWHTTETPTDANPLGVKGIGEAASIASTPAIVNAVEDALSQHGAVIERLPLTPEYVWQLLNRAPPS
ncbi:MAG: xanthine dehydrogenase family protein molybdopterin-binding subunit [Nitrososphaerota archaeon]|nr:xanthine dehydrogenase family protein molybdopterin-binding subunit [Nitrososphaerota archaeon]